MSKLSKIDIRFEIILLIIAAILGLITAFFDYSNKIYITLIQYILIIVGVWRIIHKIAIPYKEKIPGRVFEYLFFFFIFLASYSYTFMVFFLENPEKIIDAILMNIALIVTLISACYCGWFHYINGLYNDNFKKNKIQIENRDDTDLPKLIFLPDFPITSKRIFEVILRDVYERLPKEVQENLLKRCEILILGYKLGVTRIPTDKSIIILNALSMKMEDLRLDGDLKRHYHILAHEFAHVYLNHEISDEKSEKEADDLAKEWGFEKPKEYI